MKNYLVDCMGSVSLPTDFSFKFNQPSDALAIDYAQRKSTFVANSNCWLFVLFCTDEGDERVVSRWSCEPRMVVKSDSIKEAE